MLTTTLVAQRYRGVSEDATGACVGGTACVFCVSSETALKVPLYRALERSQSAIAGSKCNFDEFVDSGSCRSAVARTEAEARQMCG